MAHALLERQLDAMERPAGSRRSVWPWAFVVVGLLVVVGLAFHGFTAYSTVARVNVNSKIDTPNPVVLFQDVATNGPKVGATVESSSRATYTRALEQFVLDGTGLLLGLVLVVGGLFIRLNQ
jgi:hypothetical protein